MGRCIHLLFYMSLVSPCGVKVPIITCLAKAPKSSKMKLLTPRSDTAVLVLAYLHPGQVSLLIQNGDSWKRAGMNY